MCARIQHLLLVLAALFLSATLGVGCFSRPPDTPLHVRPTDGRPKSIAKPGGGLYRSVELREGSHGERQWQLAESSKMHFVVSVAARFGAPKVDYQPEPTKTVFGLGPYIRTVLHRQQLDVVRGSIPISGTLSIDGNRMDSASGVLTLHLGDLVLDEQNEDMGRGDELKQEVFGLPDSGRETAPVTLKAIKFGSGPRVGFQVQGEATFQMSPQDTEKATTVGLALSRSDWDRYQWTSYRPIDVTISEDLALGDLKDGLIDAWNVKEIADFVRIHLEMELEAIN